MHFLHNRPCGQPAKEVHLLLAPGSMGPMDSPALELLSQLLAACGVVVSRFEFDYMAQRRSGGKRRPPPRAERLLDEYAAAISAIEPGPKPDARLLIGGKSLGGRVASMVAEAEFAAGRIAGLVCFGYPFHPPGKADKLRTAHLEALRCPALIVQGERDPFGDREEVTGYKLAATIGLHWAVDGDHDLKPRKSSGRSHEDNLADAARAIADFADRL
jgi:predicted alpha/beta-hydrolase family hydrolase